MKPYILLSLATALAAAATSPAPAQNQSSMVQALPGTTDADRLAEQMRALAADPRDLNALLNAGELSLKLDDLSAAAALFARADKIDPRNARVKAGMGSILVRSERPGEALRYFQQATQLGLDQRRFAADRALAYDLIGEQARAQRDYRLALQGTSDDETIRRYALSLAISGQREQALAQLDPLLRKTDRGAWRTRAFVLAMAGDVEGATRIATTMMPPGTAEGLQPFFLRLPQLAPVDRAFAVHFGEIVATPSRIADARLVPPLPALGPDTSAPVLVAAAPVTQAPVQTAAVDQREERRNRRNRREKLGRVALPDTQSVQLASAAPALPPPPTYVAPVYQAPEPLPPTVSMRRSRRGSGSSAAADANRAALAAAKTGQPLAVPTTAATNPPVQVASVRPAPTPSPVVQPLPRQTYSLAAATPVRTAAPTQTPTPTPAPVLAAVPATPPPAIVAAPRESGDTVLARIIAGLTIPASELQPAKTPDRAIAPAPSASAKVRTAAAEHVLAAARAKEARDQAADKALADAAAKEDKRAAAAKAVADKKALADKKAATAKKLADAKEAAEEKKAARSNPSRIWVQVAGGANEDDLPKAWSAAKAKASALAGKPGYTAKLRATNRVLTGPFKTQAEAQKAVAELRKQGVGAFAFTSDAGQAVTKLPAK
ncbi:Tfp pilus assembly protein PilF [Sphingomonas jinjuensis]|uniref:Tfp pilus assembly protein PilF n=1 Tax=Sphingomonas jinjuensis TaxID=535907 RepID=A0A840FAM2_9SPHN|nr:tetratricopeptide repeat protein [Sphingomonas jinjuensis]MBB4154709.1 Tfp pilus assembly protein PilF [Sphingomonas jinjuensis]